MYQRISNLSKSRSFFLFGARATGKSTLLNQFVNCFEDVLKIDLLDPAIARELAAHPERLVEMVDAFKRTPSWIFVDEIQKNPSLLDVIHHLIYDRKLKFALTGSSARKLKRGHANLLAGRAFTFKLYPLTFIELGSDFDLNHILGWGSLPEIFQLEDDLDRKRYLLAYVHTYIKEEILVEQLVRNIEPFHAFLDVVAQVNGEIVNYAKLAREASIDPKSVGRYFSILEDTLLGFFLHPYSKSVRKRQVQSPKFYLFDIGIARALAGIVGIPPTPQTYHYGNLFEQLVILEMVRLNSYYEKDFKFSYLRTGAGVEIDLVVERPQGRTALVEIKSASKVIEDDLQALVQISAEVKNCECFLLCNESQSRRSRNVMIMPWQQGIREIFHLTSQKTSYKVP